MNESSNTIFEALSALHTNLGVISTMHPDSSPQSAVVYFTHDAALNLYITTRENTRKYQNILRDPRVAFVAYDQTQMKTVQLQGVAEIITDVKEQGDNFKELVSLVTKNNPTPPVDQLNGSEIVFIKIAVHWARAGNFAITREGDMFTETTV